MAGPGMVKKENKYLIRSLMMEKRRMTKPEISAETGISVVTVNGLVAEMVSAGELTEAGHAPSGGGRPSMLYEYNYDYRHFVIIYGFQYGKKNDFYYETVNMEGCVTDRRTETIGEVMTDSFDTVLDEIFQNDKKLSLIVFGLPGEHVGDSITLNDYKNIVGDTFIPHYRERYGVPVIFENDVNAMTYGDYYFGNKENDVAGIYFPKVSPPGAGLVTGGHLQHGAYHFAGEIFSVKTAAFWEAVDYTDREQVLALTEEILMMYVCVAAPDRMILYGDFFCEEDTEILRKNILEKTCGRFDAAITLADQPDRAYARGLTAIGMDWLGKIMAADTF